MAKHISQYCLLAILCIALVLTLGPTPSLSNCIYPMLCDSFVICDARCRGFGFLRGVCSDFPGTMSCCCVQ
ncbi:hypothetical protein MtrunA17_Chr3g0098101 [Medicago truncatula]|uniref:Transmembrane protein, putative n=1 Tax=Medicago truncatula TaxID=3880 RepID=G7J1C6_MEDTR|nr:transmembrane protein, putative [Medicago truncatula]RHN67017.1 hypothetical protein MtrunA17_Chr3g0098101 [Medicago truncatula]